MEYLALIDAARAEIGALTFALESGEMDDLVPTCEGWTVNDLAVHIGHFCGFWDHVLCEGTGRPKPDFPDPPEAKLMVGWVAEIASTLISEFDGIPESTPVWTWFEPDHTAKFVSRRMTHELAVHRFDAQAARGICTPIPTEVAADGIDEVLDVLVTAREPERQGSGRVMALRSTDVGTEWILTLAPDRVEVERRSDDQAPSEGGDVVVSGTASDLELTLYHRPTLSPVDLHGDYTVLDEWHRRFTF